MLTWTYRIVDEVGNKSAFSPIGVIPGVTPVIGKKLGQLPTVEQVSQAMSVLEFDICKGLPAALDPTGREKDSLDKFWFTWARNAHDQGKYEMLALMLPHLFLVLSASLGMRHHEGWISQSFPLPGTITLFPEHLSPSTWCFSRPNGRPP